VVVNQVNRQKNYNKQKNDAHYHNMILFFY